MHGNWLFFEHIERILQSSEVFMLCWKACCTDTAGVLYDRTGRESPHDAIWYSVIWYGSIWYGMVWYDAVWNGTAVQYMMICDIIWYDSMWYMIRYDMVCYEIIPFCYGVTRWDMIWCKCDAMQCDVWYLMAWYDTIWYEMAWYDMMKETWNDITFLWYEHGSIWCGVNATRCTTNYDVQYLLW